MASKFSGFVVRAVVSVALAVTALALRPATPAAAAWLSAEKALTTGVAYEGFPGKFTITGPAITKATYFRVRFEGSSDFAPAVSGKLKVKVA